MNRSVFFVVSPSLRYKQPHTVTWSKILLNQMPSPLLCQSLLFVLLPTQPTRLGAVQ